MTFYTLVNKLWEIMFSANTERPHHSSPSHGLSYWIRLNDGVYKHAPQRYIEQRSELTA